MSNIQLVSGVCPKKGYRIIVDHKQGHRFLIFKGDEHLPEYTKDNEDNFDYASMRDA